MLSRLWNERDALLCPSLRPFPRLGLAPFIEAESSAHPAPAAAPQAAPLLQLRGLRHRYRSSDPRRRLVTVLDDFDLDLPSGRITVLLGPSGCGKTTLLNLTAGLLPLQAGVILLHGRSQRGPHPSLGVVFQQPALLPWLTVAENVGFGLTLRHSEPLSAGERRGRIEETLALVGLRDHGELSPHQLSGGMAQRAALARVLVRRPRLLLLDEPFSALDAITRAEMQQLVRSIVATTGSGVLLITHDVDEALRLGDRVLLMNRHPGRIQRSWKLEGALGAADIAIARVEILAELSAILNIPPT